MKKYLLVLAVLFIAGCGTVSEKTLEYCDTESTTFIGFRVYSNADCIGASVSDTEIGNDNPSIPDLNP